jgi:hypothetical protein
LADIVVQLAGNSPALGLLLRKHTAQYVRQFGFGSGAPLRFKLQFGNSRSDLSQAPPQFEDVLCLARGVAPVTFLSAAEEFRGQGGISEIAS